VACWPAALLTGGNDVNEDLGPADKVVHPEPVMARPHPAVPAEGDRLDGFTPQHLQGQLIVGVAFGVPGAQEHLTDPLPAAEVGELLVPGAVKAAGAPAGEYLSHRHPEGLRGMLHLATTEFWQTCQVWAPTENWGPYRASTCTPVITPRRGQSASTQWLGPMVSRWLGLVQVM
jgi:hypothetical protein